MGLEEIALTKNLLLAAALILLPASLLGQAAPAVRGGIPPLSVGAFYSNFRTDFTPNRLGGAGLFVDWDLLGKLGVEGEARWLRFNEQQGLYEDNFLVGPRYSRRYGKFRPYAKFLMGGGEIVFPNKEGSGGYFAFVPGGGLDYRLSRHITIRAIDYEYQFWPSAPGGPFVSHGLTPSGFSFGAAYRIF
jgi:hypothetical protein